MRLCALPEKAIPEMTYTVSGRTLNPTHLLTQTTQSIQTKTWHQPVQLVHSAWWSWQKFLSGQHQSLFLQ